MGCIIIIIIYDTETNTLVETNITLVNVTTNNYNINN